MPDNFQVEYMVACKDGSSIRHSATLHLVSKDGTKTHCRIIRANNTIKIAAAPCNESQAYVLVLHLILAQLQATYHMFDKGQQQLKEVD